jgi:hypothetical protein
MTLLSTGDCHHTGDQGLSYRSRWNDGEASRQLSQATPMLYFRRISLLRPCVREASYVATRVFGP